MDTDTTISLDPARALSEYGDILAVIGLIVVVGLFAWIKSGGVLPFASSLPDRGTDDELTSAFNALSVRFDGVEKRLDKVETDLEHLPSSKDYHELQISMARMSERIKAMNETIDATNEGLMRIEGIFLTIATKGTNNG